MEDPASQLGTADVVVERAVLDRIDEIVPSFSATVAPVEARTARRPTMTQTPVMPVHMQRVGFDPVDELARVRADEGVTRVVTPFGLPAWLVTRYDDVRQVLADPARFSNARTDFPLAEQLQLSKDEIAQQRAGQLRSPRAHPAAADADA